MSEDVERVAKAIWDANDLRSDGPWEKLNGATRAKCIRLARAAIAAMQPNPGIPVYRLKDGTDEVTGEKP